MKLWNPLAISTEYRTLPKCQEHNPQLQLQYGAFAAEYYKTQAIFNKVTTDPEYVNSTHRMASVSFAPKLDFFEAEAGAEIHGELGSGLIPDFRNYGLFHKGENLEEVISRLWPRCPQSANPMQYLGWVNAGYYPLFIHQLTAKTEGLTCGPLGYHPYPQPLFVFHFFSGEAQPILGWNKDCHVLVDTYPKGSILSAVEEEEALAAARAFMAKNKFAESAINPPHAKLGAPKPGFDLAIEPKDERGNGFYFEWYDYAEEEHTFPIATLFGEPRSQQEAKRPISPNRYPEILAMTPVINFSDAKHDITHQFYADLRGNTQNSTAQYAIVDSSNT